MNFKNKLITKVITIASIMITIVACSSGPKGEESIFPYSSEVQCVENVRGQYRYISWGIGWDNNSAETDALKAAVMATIYKGSVSKGALCAELMSQKEFNEKIDYFSTMFKTERWRNYVQSNSQGRIDPDKRLRLPDNKVKIGVDVLVNVEKLRTDLEDDGIIKPLKLGQ